MGHVATLPRMERLKSKATKNGQPRSAVTMPTGNSVGATIVLATASATSMVIAPAHALIGSSSACRGPTMSLAICGAIKPTNPMIPALETAAAVATLAPVMTQHRKRNGSNPRDCDAASPSKNASSCRDRLHRIPTPKQLLRLATRTVCQSLPASDPINQESMTIAF